MSFWHGTLLAQGDALVFQETPRNNAATAKPLTLQLEGASAASRRSYVGKGVVLGIRPEDIGGGLGRPGVPPGRTVETVVEVVQPLGAETYLHLAGHARSFVARVPPTDHFTVGQQLRLAFDAQHAHFFDAATGKAIA